MKSTPRPLRRATLALAVALTGLLLTVPSAIGGTTAGPRAHAAATYLTGLGDEQLTMFTDPLWQQWHTKVARYIAPYDASVRSDELSAVRAWVKAAEAQHQQILIAFYHSEHTPTQLPSVATSQ